MKRIMFNDRYGLTQAVLDGRKTMTRRIITCPKSFKGEWVAGFHVYKRQSDGAILEYPCMYDADERDFDGGQILPKYKVGEIVAIAQSYKDLFEEDCQRMARGETMIQVTIKNVTQTPGWSNKMFVRADQMHHQIRITNVRVERLVDISYDDILAEGISTFIDALTNIQYFTFENAPKDYISHRTAFRSLIDKVSGKGTWESNPFVFAYEFERVK